MTCWRITPRLQAIIDALKAGPSIGLTATAIISATGQKRKCVYGRITRLIQMNIIVEDDVPFDHRSPARHIYRLKAREPELDAEHAAKDRAWDELRAQLGALKRSA